MAIVSTGYTGTVNQQQWATMMGEFSVPYTRGGPGEWNVAPTPGARGVNVSPGKAGGYGVLVTSDQVIQKLLPTPSGGQWHLIALRRDWTNPANTGVVTLPADTTVAAPNPAVSAATVPASYPGTRQIAPGTGQDDQPLAWAWVTSANTTTVVVPIHPQRNLQQRLQLVEASPVVIASIGADRENQWAARGVDLTTFQDRLNFQSRGPRTYRTDFGWWERYYAEWDVALNPGGARIAGWFPEPGTPLNCLLHKATGQSLPASSAYQSITWDAEVDDRYDMHSNSSGAQDRINIKVEGLYRISAQFTMNDAGATEHGSYICVNGVQIARTRYVSPPVGAGWKQFILSARLPLNAGDSVTIQTQGAPGASLAIQPSGSTSSEFNVEYIGPRSQ